MVEVAEGEWIEWSGGECPVPGDTLVEVRYRDGETELCPAKHLTFTSGCWWKHEGEPAYDPSTDQDFQDHSCDVVAYRTAAANARGAGI